MARPLTIPSLALLFASCSSAPDSPEIRREPAPEVAAREVQLREADQRRRELSNVLMQLDLLLDKYVAALSNSGSPRGDIELQRLDKALRELVSGKPPGSTTERLVALAADASDPIHRGIALAALGFAAQRDVMAVILQGAQLDDPQLVDRAVLGLAVLKDPRTPPGVIAAVIENQKHPEPGRIQAAWALFTLQENSQRVAEITPVWRRLLEDETVHPLILATALRGLGVQRTAASAEDRALVARFVTHPTARVRLNAAIALGRMNAQDQVEALLRMLGPGESIANVRLAARKALQALAGGVDRGYDITLWRREFDRGAKR